MKTLGLRDHLRRREMIVMRLVRAACRANDVWRPVAINDAYRAALDRLVQHRLIAFQDGGYTIK